jgi:hypothetical protein
MMFRMLEYLAGYLVWHEGRIWAISGLFAVLFLLARLARLHFPQIRSLPLLVAALMWLGYGFWEHKAHLERANIRVDLLFGWPVFFSAIGICIVLTMQSIVRAIRGNAHG